MDKLSETSVRSIEKAVKDVVIKKKKINLRNIEKAIKDAEKKKIK